MGGYSLRKKRRLDILCSYLYVVKIKGEKIEVVPQFRYLGVLDTDDGALGIGHHGDSSTDICRMKKQRFKEFEGRIFCNKEVSTLPRMQVFKCMVMTNGIYACEVWNYTRVEMRWIGWRSTTSFRLLRRTLLFLLL